MKNEAGSSQKYCLQIKIYHCHSPNVHQLTTMTTMHSAWCSKNILLLTTCTEHICIISLVRWKSHGKKRLGGWFTAYLQLIKWNVNNKSSITLLLQDPLEYFMLIGSATFGQTCAWIMNDSTRLVTFWINLIGDLPQTWVNFSYFYKNVCCMYGEITRNWHYIRNVMYDCPWSDDN